MLNLNIRTYLYVVFFVSVLFDVRLIHYLLYDIKEKFLTGMEGGYILVKLLDATS